MEEIIAKIYCSSLGQTISRFFTESRTDLSLQCVLESCGSKIIMNGLIVCKLCVGESSRYKTLMTNLSF